MPPEQLQMVTARAEPDGTIAARLTIDGRQVLVTLRPSMAAIAIEALARALAGLARGPPADGGSWG